MYYFKYIISMIFGGLFYSLFAKIKTLRRENEIINKDLHQSEKMVQIQNKVNLVEDEQSKQFNDSDINVVVNRVRKKKL